MDRILSPYFIAGTWSDRKTDLCLPQRLSGNWVVTYYTPQKVDKVLNENTTVVHIFPHVS